MEAGGEEKRAGLKPDAREAASRLLLTLMRAGKFESEGGAATTALAAATAAGAAPGVAQARDFDCAAVAFDDAVGDGEAEAGALRAFGGEKRFEDAVVKLGRDAFARVADGDDEPPFVLRLAQLDAPAGGHRVERVE